MSAHLALLGRLRSGGLHLTLLTDFDFLDVERISVVLVVLFAAAPRLLLQPLLPHRILPLLQHHLALRRLLLPTASSTATSLPTLVPTLRLAHLFFNFDLVLHLFESEFQLFFFELLFGVGNFGGGGGRVVLGALKRHLDISLVTESIVLRRSVVLRALRVALMGLQLTAPSAHTYHYLLIIELLGLGGVAAGEVAGLAAQGPPELLD